MKIFKKRIIRTVVAVLLITCFLSQAVLAAESVNLSTENPGKNSAKDVPNSARGLPTGQFGWLISLQEVPNVVLAGKYKGSTANECSLSIVDKYLYDYPTEYIYDYFDNAGKYAYIEYGTGAEKWQTMNANGTRSNQTVANAYSATDHRGDAGSFSTAAQLIETNGNYAVIKDALKQRTLTYKMLQGCIPDASISNAINSFVGLWYNTAEVDDRITAFTTEPADFYDKMIRYLDIFLIVNKMCNYAYNGYIDNFCRSLNSDYSASFLTVLVASGMVFNGGGGKALATLPVWYAFRTKNQKGVEQLLHPGGMVGESEGIFSETNTTNDYENIQNFYNGIATNASGEIMANGNANAWWWEGGKRLALSVFPKSVMNANSGNVGYTYFSTLDTALPDPPPQPKKPEPEVPQLQFYISAESDDYMVAPETTEVSATVTIDFKQTELELRKLKTLYDEIIAKNKKTVKEGDKLETALEIVIQRGIASRPTPPEDMKPPVPRMEDSTGHLIDIEQSKNSFSKNYVDCSGDNIWSIPYNMAIFRLENADWDEAYRVFTGYSPGDLFIVKRLTSI